MYITKPFLYVLPIAVAGLISSPASAELVSEWSVGLGAKARLIAGATENGNQAGIEIVLEEGWKTYWRNPGAGGIPPVFNWLGSQNISGADVSFPVPHRYQDSYGTSMGYKQSVIFPVSFVVIDPDQPVVLELKLDYAVCEKLCVPVQANLSLELPTNISLGLSQGLQDSVALVPVANGADDPHIVSVQFSGSPENSWLDVTARFPNGPSISDTFVEGPEGWFLPAPEFISQSEQGQNMVINYRVSLNALPKDASIAGAPLLFTLATDGSAVEQPWVVE